MNKQAVLIAAVIASTSGAVSAAAQENNVCLREMYIKSTAVHDEATIVVTGIRNDQYTVSVTETCNGLTDLSMFINFEAKAGGAGCIRHGDQVGFSMPGDTRVNYVCLVDTISEGAPR
jgi:hypothetical protein